MVATSDLGSDAERRGGSSPFVRTKSDCHLAVAFLRPKGLALTVAARQYFAVSILLRNFEKQMDNTSVSKLSSIIHLLFRPMVVCSPCHCPRSADRSSSPRLYSPEGVYVNLYRSVLALLTAVRVPGSALGWLVVYLQTLQNVDLSSYKNFLIALYFFAIKNRVRVYQHKIFLLTFAVELEWWC